MAGRRSDATTNRGLLLDAARHVFAEKGLSAEVKEIAAVAGVGIGTFYRNFPRKDDLVLALLDEATALSTATFDEVEGRALPAEESIRLILERSFDLVEQYGYLLEALWSGQLPPEWRDRTSNDRNKGRMEALIHRGIAESSFRDDLDAGTATSMLTGPIVLGAWPLQGLTAKAAAQGIMKVFLDGARMR